MFLLYNNFYSILNFNVILFISIKIPVLKFEVQTREILTIGNPEVLEHID